MGDVGTIVQETLSILSKLVNNNFQENSTCSDEDENVALDCFVKLFAKVELSDHMSILSFAVGLLTIQPTGESLPIQCKICDTLCRLVVGDEPGIKGRYGKWKEILTNELVNDTVNIFKAIETMLLMQASNDHIGNTKIISCVKLLTTLLDGNAYIKKSFDENFGLKKFESDLKLHQNMTEKVAESLLELLTISNTKNTEISQRVITLPELVVVLMELVPRFDDDGQRLLCETIRVMCATRLENRLICCHIQLISQLLKLIDDHGEKLSGSIKDCLISIMEILGCLSISADELKSLIALFQKKSKNDQFRHADRLVQSLERMASQNAQYHGLNQPQYFINFYDIYSPSYIKAPSIQRWNGKGLTVHTWVCLDFTLPNMIEYRQCKIRHVLYSFLNSRGEGFEAFFTQDGFLVLAVHTRKEFLTTTVTSSPFNDQEWHCVSIVHTRKLLGRATVSVYVDGQEIHNAQLAFPSLNKEKGTTQDVDVKNQDISHSYIGHGVKSDSKFHYQIHPPSSPINTSHDGSYPDCIAAGHQNQTWGIPVSLKGQMSQFVLFNESLPLEKIKQLAAPGPNYQHLFTAREVLSNVPLTDTASLVSHIVFYFNAKAAVGREIVDLQTSFKDKLQPEEINLIATIHHVWSIQEAIQSLGGLSVLFPLLEQAYFKHGNRMKPDYSILDIADNNGNPNDVDTERNGDDVTDSTVATNETSSPTSTSSENVIRCFMIGGSESNAINIVPGSVCEVDESDAGLDAIDGKTKPMLSDLSVSYSPKHNKSGVINPQSEWHHTLDNELDAITVEDPDGKIIVASNSNGVNTFTTPDSSDIMLNQERSQSLGSFSLIVNQVDRLPPANSGTNLSDWTLLDPKLPRTRSETYKKWAKQDNHELNGVAHFISLLRYMIASRKQNQDMAVDLQAIKIIGLLLQSCDPHLINIGFLNSVAQLIESILGVKDDLLEAVYKFILFDFKIWSNADLSVQIAHTQLLHTYIKEDPVYFSKIFGLNFFIQVIEQYYCDYNSTDKEFRLRKEFKLSESEERDLRKAHLGLIFFLVKLSPNEENIASIVRYMASLSKHEHLDEVLDLLSALIKSSISVTSISNLLAESGCYILYRWLVYDIPNKTRLKILDIMNFIIQNGKLSETAKQKVMLKPDLFPAVGELLCKQDISRDVVVQLMKLGISEERSAEAKTDIYKDFGVILSVVRIAHFTPRPVKLEVAIKIRHSLKLEQTSAYRCSNEHSWYEPLWKILLIENNSSSDMDVMEAELVQVVIEIIHIVMWFGIDGSDQAAWIKRSEPITSLHVLSSKNTFLLPALVVERQLYEMCLHACAMALTNAPQPYAVDSQNAVQVLRLLEVFLSSKEISSPEVLKWSCKLISNLFILLDAMHAYEDSTEGGSEWVEVLQITERILYQAFQLDDVDILELANYKLSQLLNKRVVLCKEEACYQFLHIHQVLQKLQKMNISCEMLLMVLLQRYERFGPYFFMTGYLPNLPLLRPGTFKKEFLQYMLGQEYQDFIEEISKTAVKFEYDTFSESPLTMDRLWMESLNSMSASTQKRQIQLEESLQNFSRLIYFEFDEKRNDELTRLEDCKRSYRQRNGLTKKAWDYQKRFLTSERGAWGSTNNRERHFKLSNTENRYRMRLKLTENTNYNPHTDAARMRDIGDQPDLLVRKEELLSLPVSMDSEEGVLSDDDEKLLSPTNEEEEEDCEQDAVVDASHLYDLEIFDDSTGNTIYFAQCHLVTLMDVIPGRIELTSTHICFYDERETITDTPYDFRVYLNELREVYSRRYNLNRTAMEFFLLDRSSYFVNFQSTKEKEKYYKELIGQKPCNLYYSGIQNPMKLLRVSKLTNKWVEREISNFEYIMQLNTISGRTYNDLAQYPVFPWVLTDYTSENIDLTDESVYRDLTKPVGALNPKRAEDIKNRFDTFVDVSGMTPRSHYFTHYSNPGGVLHYLVRVEPFTSLHIQLQGGKFDCADRQFYSISTAWNTIMNGSDVKELIPEFYFFPEFLENLNSYSFGHLQEKGTSQDVDVKYQRNGDRVDDVMLPAWAKDAHDFVNIHRQALESDYVSANLHSWIDLIFGYKQRGKESEKALNVFSHYSYEGAVDLTKIDDPVMREATEGMINNFGQTPTQLLKKPHPKRKTQQEIDAGKPKVINNLEHSTFSLIEINNTYMNTPVIFIATCKTKSFIRTVPDLLVTVHLNRLFGIHAWLPFADTKTNSFSFTMDVLLASAASHAQRTLPGTRFPSLELSSRLFAFTTDGHLMISCGYWDNTIRLVNTDRGKDKLKACVCHHNDIVTCISLDADGSHLISGSADLTCAIWKIEQTNGFSSSLSKQPVQTLYGHDACITAVAMYGDLDMAISGDQEGTCLVHTLRRGMFLHSLTPYHTQYDNLECYIIQVKISEHGRIVILSNITGIDTAYSAWCSVRIPDAIIQVKNIRIIILSNITGMDTPHHFITVYSINGMLLGNFNLNQVVSDMCVVNDYLVTGSMNGTLQIRHVNDFSTPVVSKNVRSPIFTVAATYNGSHIFIGLGDGNILVMCPSKTTN